MKRRRFLALPIVLGTLTAHAAVEFAVPHPQATLEFPRDHGAHPRFRTEWWYLTGWVRDASGHEYGFQVTFFRNRPGLDEASRSRFAPRQLLFAHAAVADPAAGRLRHDQRAARAGFGLATASEDTTDVTLGEWALRLAGGRYEARIDARDFALALNFIAAAPPLLQGARGLSRKGPLPEQTSHYYSRPQLPATGTITLDGVTRDVEGLAWLDHEWSSSYLAANAQGWDWTGINFDDGSALMAFRIRGRDGSVVWRGGTLRTAAGEARELDADAIRFTPLRQWRSPHTSIDYPVAFRVQADGLDVTLEPLLDDQELDSRASVGTIYWEGAVRARSGNRVIGRGYLELTGYGAPLRL
jgi:predicted secreted hydrolase